MRGGARGAGVEMAQKTYDQLDPEVQAFLGRLDGKDVHLLERSIDITRKIASTASVIRWCVISVAALIVLAVTISENVGKLRTWITGH